MPHITFIHGIANKPEENKLKKIWLDALSTNLLGNGDGIDLGASGITTSMIYWQMDCMTSLLKKAVFENAVDFESNEAVAVVEGAEPGMP